MRVTVAPNEPPESWTSSVFLAGPTPRKEGDTRWRDKAIAEFKKRGFDGVILDPEREDWPEDKEGYEEQIHWEQEMRERCDVILFFVPRHMELAPGLTTNIEFGQDLSGWKVVYGRPNDAVKMDYMDLIYKQRYKVVHETSIEATVQAAMDMIETLTEKIHDVEAETSALREDGETYVPLHIWSSPQFQSWYKAQLAVGNRLDAARVEYAFVMPKAGLLFMFVLWVKVWIEAEQRHKENEFIVSRTDISTIVAYKKALSGSLADTELVLVQEFRSPVRNSSGFVYELPGGSSIKPGQDPLQIAAEELHEETGIKIDDPKRFVQVMPKQLVATMLTHQAHVFAIELTEEEMAVARAKDAADETHGLEEDSEKTYVRVTTFGELPDRDVDWSTIGMITTALRQEL
ncbi:hypothetical protein LCGC14_0164520 [marine sediment metagenome]|uniref:Nudix hydrolase domain-containing protein n=1 Tax=marine sediment metagenome TaxID=412755 RepID=A0A0F9XWN7_9ZZZZ